MVIFVDQMSDEPIYLQLRSQIVSAIAKGELNCGDALPSVRSLASDLGINLHTVNKAYAVLRDEGYVTMRGRSGAYVADYGTTASASRREEGLARITGSLQRLALEYRAQGGDEQGFTLLAARAAKTVFADQADGSDTPASKGGAR